MYGHNPPANEQWVAQGMAQGGYSRPTYDPRSMHTPSPQESQAQVNSWPAQAPPTTAMPAPPQNWPSSTPPNSGQQTWPNTSVMPPRTMNPNYQSFPSRNNPTEFGNNTRNNPTEFGNNTRNNPTEFGNNTRNNPTEFGNNTRPSFDGTPNKFNSWAKPMPLFSGPRKRPLPVEDGDFPDKNVTRPRSDSWVKPDDWSKSDDRPRPGSNAWDGSDNRGDSWSNSRPSLSETWSKPNADRPRPPWSKPNADNRPPWSKPNAGRPPWPKNNDDRPTWSKPNSDNFPNKSNDWSKPSRTTPTLQFKSKPKVKAAMDPRAVLGSIVTTYYVNQEKVNMPKELTSQFEPLKCGLCGVLVNSTVTAKTHYSGKVHDKKVVQFMQKWCAEKGQPLPEQFKEGVSRKQSSSLFDQARTLYCSVCSIPLTSKQHAEQHYMGKSHKKALDLGGLKKSITPMLPKPDPTGRFNIGVDFIKNKNSDPLGLMDPETPENEETVKPNTNPFVCQLCSVSTTSKEQLEVHLGGARHRKKLTAVANTTSADKQKIPPAAAQTDTILSTLVQRPKTVVRAETQDPPDEKKPDFSIFRTPSGQYYCAFCNVTMNSESQFEQHTESKRHKLSVANNKGKNSSHSSTGNGPTKPVVKTVQQ